MTEYKRNNRKKTGDNHTNKSKPTQNSGRYYQYSSEAYDLDIDYEYPTEVRRRIKKKVLSKSERVKKIRQRSKPKFILNINHNNKISLSTYVYTAIIFTFVFGFVFSHGLVEAEKLKLQKTKAELTTLKIDNDDLKAAMYESLDLKEIEMVAKTKLGMVKPGDYQIIYAEIPKQSYFDQYIEEEKSNDFIFSNFLGLFVK